MGIFLHLFSTAVSESALKNSEFYCRCFRSTVKYVIFINSLPATSGNGGKKKKNQDHPIKQAQSFPMCLKVLVVLFLRLYRRSHRSLGSSRQNFGATKSEKKLLLLWSNLKRNKRWTDDRSFMSDGQKARSYHVPGSKKTNISGTSSLDIFFVWCFLLMVIKCCTVGVWLLEMRIMSASR